MSFELAKKCVDFFLEHSIDTLNPHIGFYGGEPLIEFELMRRIIEYSEEKFRGKNITFNLTTNASLLTDKIIEYFIIHNVSIMISLDGAKNINDKNRVFAGDNGSTFDVVYSKLVNIYNKYPEYFKKISINMVLDPSINHYETLSLLKNDNLLQNITLQCGIVNDKGLNKNIYSKEFLRDSRYNAFLLNLKLLTNNNKIRTSKLFDSNESNIIDKISSFSPRDELPLKGAPSGPCIAGQTKLFINVDGNFYPCERVNENNNDMIIGNIVNGFNIEKVKKLVNLSKVTQNKCKNCWAFSLCEVCPNMSDEGDKLNINTISYFCNQSLVNAQNKLYTYALYKEYGLRN